MLLFVLTLLVAPADQTADACAGSPDEARLLACRQRVDREQAARIAALTARLLRRAADEPGNTQAIRAADVAWTRFRDAECLADTYESRDGSAYAAHLLACRARLNAARIAALQDKIDAP